MTYLILSQRDPRWSNFPLGLDNAARSSSIGAYGCAVTCIAQKLIVMGFTSSPVMVQTQLKVNRAFGGRSNNLIMWSLVQDAYPQLRYNGRADYPDKPLPPNVMQMIRDRLTQGNPVIIYVDASKYERGLQQHFVLIEGELESGFVILNPWNGKREDLRAYGATDEIAICGCIWLDPAMDKAQAA